MQAPLLGFASFRVIGVLLIVVAIPILLESLGRFAFQGVGSPAPIFPTQHLVVKGFYRYVRNPMYVAVVSVILGQALLLGNIRVLAYAILVWLAFYLFVLIYEEPTLRKSFGAEYETCGFGLVSCTNCFSLRFLLDAHLLVDSMSCFRCHHSDKVIILAPRN